MIRMKTTYAGPSGVIAAGQTADLPKAEEKALIDGGYAEPITADAPPKKRSGKAETAANPGQQTTETATEPGGQA